MDRLACVIAAGVWDGKRALLKNRDRKYTPRVTLVRELLDGVEVAYMRDNVTGWCEGLNEHGIGIANAALAVGLDEAEGTATAVEDKKGKKGKALDGARILKALSCRTVQDAIDSLCSHLGGLEGHSFVSDPNRVFSVELINGDCVTKPLEGSEIHVRTNHGRDTGGTGYTDGEGYLSSAARKEKSTQILRQSKTPTDLGPDLMRNRSEGPRTHNDPVRDTDSMATTSQMVMNLTDRELDFYVIPGKMDYEGLEDRLPKDYSPKIKVRAFSYRNGGKELVEVNPKTGLVRKSVDPVKLAARVASRFITADVPKKYEHIDFKPPQSVADAAEKGLEYREKASPSNKGGLTPAEAAEQGIGSGVQRAVNLKNRDNISPDTIKQMTAFFSRHEKNKGVAPENKGEPWNDKGNVSWLIWGGDPGRAWAEKVKGQMEAADEKAKKTADLSPPLGLNGGPCKVVDRINRAIRNPALREKLTDDAETGDLSNPDARKVYPLTTESGSGFKSFTILPHAQFRMDYRSVTVKDVEAALNSFIVYAQGLQKVNPDQYEALLSQEKIEWVDPKTRLKVVFATDAGRIEIVTVFWKGRQDPPPTVCEVPVRSASVRRVVSQHLDAIDPVATITGELETLEALASDIQAVLDTYAETVPMPVVGRIAALTLHSQTEVFAKSEHGMRHAERVIAHCRTYLTEHPSDATISAALRDAQMLYERFEAFRAQAREVLSALSQKIMPKDLRLISSAAVDEVRAGMRFPNSLSITVHPHFVPCKVGDRTVDGMAFSVYLTVYPQPKDNAQGAPEYQQFLLSQCTLGDTSVYLTVIDRTNEKSPTKPVKVTDGAGAAKKILAALKGWSGLV